MKQGLPFNYKIYTKKNRLYVVVDYKDRETGEKKRKWLPTGLDSKTKKKEADKVANGIAIKFIEDYYTDINTTSISTTIIPETSDTVPNPLYNLPNNAYSPPKLYEFSEFMHLWLETMRPRVARTTFKGYTAKINIIERYFKPKKIYLHELKPLDIQGFYNYLYSNGSSGNNIKHYHANIHSALKYAVKNDFIVTNPSDKVDLPKIVKYQATFYSKEELDKLFMVFKGDRMELVVYIGAFYGLRRCEIIGLQWDAIDFQKKTITISRKVVNEFGRGKEIIYCETELKTASTRRTLPLIPYIEMLLRKKLEDKEYYVKLLKGGYDHTYDNYVCVDCFGKLITPDYVTNHFRYIVRKAGLKQLRFHDLRHSCASLLLANGVSMKQIQDWLGHSTFNVTANFYSHLDYNSRIESAETIAKIFSDNSDDEDKDVNGKNKQ